MRFLSKYVHFHWTFQNDFVKFPVFNLFFIEKFGRYFVSRTFIKVFIALPIFGIIRREYIKGKFLKQLKKKQQQNQVELQESLTKLDVHIGANDDYMVVIVSDQSQNTNEYNQDEVQKERKVFNLSQQIKNNPNAEQLKWVFLGSKNTYQLIKDSGIEFYEKNQEKRNEPKVYLVGRNEEGEEKVLMDWQLGVPFHIINKYISKHKYKKYLKSVSF